MTPALDERAVDTGLHVLFLRNIVVELDLTSRVDA